MVKSALYNIYWGYPANLSICYRESESYSLHARNCIGREKKEASSVEVKLVVVQLHLVIYWSDLGKRKRYKISCAALSIRAIGCISTLTTQGNIKISRKLLRAVHYI